MPEELTYEATGGGPTTGASTSVTSSTASSTGVASSSGSTTSEASSVASSSSGAGGGGGSSSSTGDGGAASSTGAGGAASSSGGDGGGGSASSSTGTGGTGGTGGAGGTSPCPASDDFEAGRGPCWEVFNEDLAETTFEGGVATVVPDVDTFWDGFIEAHHWFQEVEGDFSATLRVTTEPTEDGTYQLAGFFLRDPEASPPSWVQYATGTGFFADTSYYIALTVDGQTFEEANALDGLRDGVLGMCRRGDNIIFARYIEDEREWGVGTPYDPDTYARMPRLPERIHVGFATGNEDETFTATFDDFGLRLGGGNCKSILTELHP
jgi:hypothetical protein